MLNIKKEISFWTENMKDHSSFQYHNITPEQQEDLEKAKHFITRFSQLNTEIKNISDRLLSRKLDVIITKNIELLRNFIRFKEYLIAKLSQSGMELKLTPSLLNHMINEAVEYLNILAIARQGSPLNKTLENIRLHTIWLRDSAGHGAAIATSLDPKEIILIATAEKFQKKFNNMSVKAFELYPLYNKAALKVEAISQFNELVEKEVRSFIRFIDSIRLLKVNLNVAENLQPIILEHIIKEENYYLQRIKELAEEELVENMLVG